MDKNFLDTLSKDGDAYSIRSAEDLCNLSEYVNAGNDCDEKIFKLANDIDLSSVENFTPIGNYDNPFVGTFDGDGKIISNLKIVGENYVGLFGCNAGKIKNLNLSKVEIKACNFIGGLVGFNYGGTIENCTASGTVCGSKLVGGLVGNNDNGTIENCTASGTVCGVEDVGGLVGSNGGGTIENCTASGNVCGVEDVGGLVGYYGGYYGGKIQNCSASGSVSGKDSVGGFVGSNGGKIQNCSASGSVSGNMNVGGLVGSNDSDIENFSGAVSNHDEII